MKVIQLMSYLYRGFWQCMDMLREEVELEKLLDSGNACGKDFFEVKV